MTQLLCTIGISGSGKTTYLKKFPKESIISPDEIRKEFGDVSTQKNNAIVWKLAKERVLERLSNNLDTILDSTFTVSKNRKRFLEDIPKDVELVAVVFPLPDLTVAFQRIQKDITEGKERSNVPKNVLERQKIQLINGYKNIELQFDKIIYI